ncbi:hypothetical protein CGK30_23160, partial [Vibrio parahaemolyticus]
KSRQDEIVLKGAPLVVNLTKNLAFLCKVVLLVQVSGHNSHNKAFKTDSQRMAFLVLFSLSVYGTIG